MTTHKIGTREQWLTARTDLLKAEKEHTRRGDELARWRQELPWVRVDKEYMFDTETGQASLKDLFLGRTQLIVYHFMFGPDYEAGCPSCSSIADGFNGVYVHLANHDVTLMAVSRAPLEKLLGYRKRMGWTFPWASSDDNGFNADYSVSFTEQEQRTGTIEYNYKPRDQVINIENPSPLMIKIAATCGTDVPTYARDLPGLSSFVVEDGVIYHTYSAYARGLDAVWGMYPWLDRAPKGRNEDSFWLRRHDEY